MTPKAKASKAMSRYVRLRDAIAYCKEYNIDLRQFSKPEDIIGKCSTCGTVKAWLYMDAGHWKTRGMGGSSGAYFMPENVHLQCKRCNAFESGRPTEMENYIREKYGDDIVSDITLQHHIRQRRSGVEYAAMEELYKQEYKQLIEENGL